MRWIPSGLAWSQDSKDGIELVCALLNSLLIPASLIRDLRRVGEASGVIYFLREPLRPPAP